MCELNVKVTETVEPKHYRKAKRLIASNFIRALVKPPLEVSQPNCAVCTV